MTCIIAISYSGAVLQGRTGSPAGREAKIEKAKLLRKERNKEERKGGETAGAVS